MDNIQEIFLRHGKWTSEEDEALRQGLSKHGERKWRLISDNVPGRSPIQCLHRWTKILKPGLIKGTWTKEEDLILASWVQEQGPTKWAKCSKRISGRNGKQCRERWCNNLDPEVKKGKWNADEDAIIFNMFQGTGAKWAFIAKFLPGRTENSIKNRFYSTIRKMNHRKIETDSLYFPDCVKNENIKDDQDCDFEESGDVKSFAGYDISQMDSFSNFIAQSEFAMNAYFLNMFMCGASIQDKIV